MADYVKVDLNSPNTCAHCGEPLPGGGLEGMALNIDAARGGQVFIPGHEGKAVVVPTGGGSAPGSFASLKSEAEHLGIKVPKGITRDDLQGMIDVAKAERAAGAEAEAKMEQTAATFEAAKAEAKSLGLRFGKDVTLDDLQKAIAEVKAKAG